MTALSNRPVVGVLALQGDVVEHLRALERSGAHAVSVRRPEELERVDGLVIPGGESTTMTHLLRVFDLDEPLRERLSAGMPAYGSCAGMIMLASQVVDHDASTPKVKPLGALDVQVRRNAFGRQVDSFEAELDFQGIDGGPMHAVFIRAPWVEKVSEDVTVLATVHPCSRVHSQEQRAGRIVAVRQGAVLATAFHPELVAGDERVHQFFVKIVKEQNS